MSIETELRDTIEAELAKLVPRDTCIEENRQEFIKRLTKEHDDYVMSWLREQLGEAAEIKINSSPVDGDDLIFNTTVTIGFPNEVAVEVTPIHRTDVDSIKEVIKGIEEIANDFRERSLYMPLSIIKLNAIADEYKRTMDEYLKSNSVNAELVIRDVSRASGNINIDCHFEAHDEYANKYLQVLDKHIPEDDILTWEKVSKELENGL